MTVLDGIHEANMAGSRLGDAVFGRLYRIDPDFTAKHFPAKDFGGRMDPPLMVDHFVMTGPTLAPQLHAGISAVTVMLEDSTDAFLNRDKLGREVALEPGDLYWLAAASGAAHEEVPAAGAWVHALQVFVDLPARLNREPARALLDRAADVPKLEGRGHRVRVDLGRSGGVSGAGGTPEEMTLLDGFLELGGVFVHARPAGRQAWIYAVSGRLSVRCREEVRLLPEGGALAVGAGSDADLILNTTEASDLVLMAARPVCKPSRMRGALAMTTAAEVGHRLALHARGELGHIPA